VSEHTSDIEWRRGGKPFDTGYDRTHTWTFDSGVTVPASAAPGLNGDPTRVDPEEAFVASISSCHMLWFLYLAAEAGHTVDAYVDHATGTMRRDERGITCITDVTLHPGTTWAGDAPTRDEIDDLHHRSHERCFIANSVRTAITIEHQHA